MRVVVNRYKGDHNQTTGVMIVMDRNGWPHYVSPCIERGARDNKKNVSRIPEGIYPLILEYSPRFDRMLFEIKEVPNRSECKIHSANFWHQLNGCLSPGEYIDFIDSDNYLDVAKSRKALDRFHKIMSGVVETTIEIKNPSHFKSNI